MRQPREFSEPGKEYLYYHLQKSLYGLRQSPHTWYERIDLKLTKFNMIRNNYDSNMYYLNQQGNTVILMVYVDDLFIIGSSASLISILK